MGRICPYFARHDSSLQRLPKKLRFGFFFPQRIRAEATVWGCGSGRALFRRWISNRKELILKSVSCLRRNYIYLEYVITENVKHIIYNIGGRTHCSRPAFSLTSTLIRSLHSGLIDASVMHIERTIPIPLLYYSFMTGQYIGCGMMPRER